MPAILQLLIKGISALYIGHSLVSPNLPERMSAVLDAPVEYSLINGAPLQILWRDSATAQGVDGRAWLSAHPVDALVITERVPLATTVEWHESPDYAKRWVELAAKANPEVRSYLYQTWDDIDDPQAWRDRIVADLPIWQKIVDDVNAGLPELKNPMQLVPAGVAMVHLQEAIGEGRVPGMSSIRDVFDDNIHPNPNGWYFITMVHYATLTGESPVGLPLVLKGKDGPYPRVPADLAAALQQVAEEAVEEFRARP
ncbi:MAG TPA: hypothetical protein VNQ78_19715 [Paracoccus sp. (in: a-proteobacteria)]|uniref:hypothetical protein n=1 Tax=Paracoccus sp. TaxID=267 RepID=UPI002CEEEA90|nr:hypothetical protein [Paracoccus sp. (in: a-proteobacteria)]HWL58885.1 hypothetical protein [Paracoccus sp. (in: a-proteobacteria)]